MRTKIILVLLVSILLISLVFIGLDKPDIHSTTIEELENTYGIGEVLSVRVSLFLKANPEANVDDLIEVDGIGPVKLKLLKKRWR